MVISVFHSSPLIADKISKAVLKYFPESEIVILSVDPDDEFDFSGIKADVLFVGSRYEDSSSDDLIRHAVEKNPELQLVVVSDGTGDMFNPVGICKNAGFIKYGCDEFDICAQIASYCARRSYIREVITFNVRKSTYTLSASKVIYLEGKKNNVFAHLDDDILKITAKISDFEGISRKLIRVHQSFMVNFDYVSMLEGSTVTLESGLNIPVSRTYIKQAREAFSRITGRV